METDPDHFLPKDLNNTSSNDNEQETLLRTPSFSRSKHGEGFPVC